MELSGKAKISKSLFELEKIENNNLNGITSILKINKVV